MARPALTAIDGGLLPRSDIELPLPKGAAVPRDAGVSRGEWQPIATAPKDGTPIIGREKWVERQTGILRYRVRRTRWGKTSHVPLYGWTWGRYVEDIGLWHPTHWKPLVAPPAEGSDAA